MLVGSILPSEHEERVVVGGESRGRGLSRTKLLDHRWPLHRSKPLLRWLRKQWKWEEKTTSLVADTYANCISLHKNVYLLTLGAYSKVILIQCIWKFMLIGQNRPFKKCTWFFQRLIHCNVHVKTQVLDLHYLHKYTTHQWENILLCFSCRLYIILL